MQLIYIDKYRGCVTRFVKTRQEAQRFIRSRQLSGGHLFTEQDYQKALETHIHRFLVIDPLGKPLKKQFKDYSEPHFRHLMAPLPPLSPPPQQAQYA